MTSSIVSSETPPAMRGRAVDVPAPGSRVASRTQERSADAVWNAVTIIAAALLIRSTLCQLGGLGVDETYTMVQSRHLDWSYFDHPPLQYWITHVAVSVFGETRLARLPFIVLFAATSWILFRLTARLYDRTSGVWAVAGLNLAAFFTVSAGSWIVPDGPLLFGLATGASGVARVLFPAPGENATPWRSWTLAGFGFGIAALSKYHAIVVAAGVLALLLTPGYRRHLRHPAAWVGGMLAFTMALPVLGWNMAHGWASIAFQVGRTSPSGIFPSHLLGSAAGQMALLTPWVAAAVIAALYGAARRKFGRPADRFCVALAAPTIGLFGLASLFGHVAMPHWSMPGWFFLFPLTGHAFTRIAARRPRTAELAAAAGIVGAMLLLLLGLQTSMGLFSGLLPPVLRDKDPTLEAFGWEGLRSEANLVGASARSYGMIVTTDWASAGKLDLAFAGAVPVLPASLDPRGYAFTTTQDALLGRDALVIVPKARIEAAHRLIDPHFGRIGPDRESAIWRGVAPQVVFVMFRAGGFLSPFAWPYGTAR